MPKNRLQAIPLGVFDAAGLTYYFQPIYAGGLPYALALLRINNKSTVDIIISYDGTTDHEYIQTGDVFELSAQMNSQPKNSVMYVPAGSLLSVKFVGAAGVGNIYVSGYYTGE